MMDDGVCFNKEDLGYGSAGQDLGYGRNPQNLGYGDRASSPGYNQDLCCGKREESHDNAKTSSSQDPGYGKALGHNEQDLGYGDTNDLGYEKMNALGYNSMQNTNHVCTTQDLGYGNTTPDLGCSSTTPDLGYGNTTQNPGYASTTPDLGYGGTTPDLGYGGTTQDLGYGSTTTELGYASTTQDLGYCNTPNLGYGSVNEGVGYGQDLRYGYNGGSRRTATEKPSRRERPRRRCSVTKYSLSAQAQVQQNYGLTQAQEKQDYGTQQKQSLRTNKLPSTKEEYGVSSYERKPRHKSFDRDIQSENFTMQTVEMGYERKDNPFVGTLSGKKKGIFNLRKFSPMFK